MKNLFRKKLAVRTAAIILAVFAALGSLMIGIAAATTYSAERASQLRQLEGLLDTVMNTARIAVFLEDGQLAEEITRGLLVHEEVAGVIISAGGQPLATAGYVEPESQGGRYNKPEVLTQPIVSPFPPEQTLGGITLISSSRVLAQNIWRSTFRAVTVQVAELFVVGLCIVLVVMRLVTRPITTISNRLHHLNISLGEKIPFPAGRHQKDEIGQLVDDVNIMIDRVVNLLDTEKSLRQELEVNERKFRSIFENATSAIFLVDREGKPLSYNSAFLHLFHLSATTMARNPDINLYQLVGEQSKNLRTLIEAAFADSRNQEIEVCVDPVAPRWLKMVLSPGEDGTVQIVANEITSFKTAFSEVEKKTMIDPLTGLGNRLGVDKKLAELLDPNSNHSANASTLFFIDLDHFKEVNDTYGHQAGDAVLIKFADIIQRLIRKTDYAARLGGDEFVVILRDMDEPGFSARFAGELLAEVAKPFAVDADTSVTIGASIGIASAHAGEVSPRELLESADAAMYRAKQQGRHRFCFHRPSG